MSLNTIQFVRALALVEGLCIMQEKASERGVIHPLDDKTKVLSPDGKTVTRQSLTIKALQDYTEGQGDRFYATLI